MGWDVYYVMMIMWSGNMIAHYIFMWEVFSFLARWKSNHDKLSSWAVDVIYFSVGGAWTNEWSPRRRSPVKHTDQPCCPKRQVTTRPFHFIGRYCKKKQQQKQNKLSETKSEGSSSNQKRLFWDVMNADLWEQIGFQQTHKKTIFPSFWEVDYFEKLKELLDYCNWPGIWRTSRRRSQRERRKSRQPIGNSCCLIHSHQVLLCRLVLPLPSALEGEEEQSTRREPRGGRRRISRWRTWWTCQWVHRPSPGSQSWTQSHSKAASAR